MDNQKNEYSTWKSLWHLYFCMALVSSNANAQAEEDVEELIVLGRAVSAPDLGAISRAGSRLGLTVLETPASIELIDSSVMRARGYKSVSDAVKSLPGVVSGESPAAPIHFFNAWIQSQRSDHSARWHLAWPGKHGNAPSKYF